MEEFRVIKIEEDVDYGCEERPDDEPVMALLTVRDTEENEQIIRYPDEELYRMGISEGDRILRDPRTGEIVK